MDDVFDFNLGEFVGKQQRGVGIINLSLLDEVVLLYSVFLAVVLHIDPELVLIADYFVNFDHVVVFLDFFHYLSDSVVQFYLFLGFI